jgi:hypothetical protein
MFIFNERQLEKVLAEYVGYLNHWRPHRSIGKHCALRTGGRYVLSKRSSWRDHRNACALGHPCL